MSSRAELPLVTFVVWKCQLSLMGIMNELVGQRLSWDQKWNRDIKLESFIDSGLRGDCEGSRILNIARRARRLLIPPGFVGSFPDGPAQLLCLSLLGGRKLNLQVRGFSKKFSRRFGKQDKFHAREPRDQLVSFSIDEEMIVIS